MVHVVSPGMRAWLVAVVVIAGCKSAGKTPAGTAPPQNLNIAKVASAAVLAADARPPFLIFVDETTTVRIGAAASWADVAKPEVMAKAKIADLEAVDHYSREVFGLGQDPVRALAEWDPKAAIDLATLEDTRTGSSMTQDDPPPPPPEDDGSDESGGTGTAMALEEGKMGKKDSDRAEGQYKMAHPDRAEGQYKMQKDRPMRGPRELDSLAKLPKATDVLDRLSRVEGEVMETGKFDRLRMVIFAPPTMKATKLIELVAHTEAAIAVVHDGTVRPLRIDFSFGRDSMNITSEPRYWLEARVSTKALVIEAVPDAPVEATLEPKALAAAIDKARTVRGAEANAPIDVLVDADVDVQRLVDVLVALDTAGARSIGMGPAPTPEELELRGHRTPYLALGVPSANGDLDKAEIRKVMLASKPKFLDCYTKALATQPTLTGTVLTEFFISPEGKVPSATSEGVDPGVATCVQNTIKALVFPKPKGGSGVQVNYPVTMRP